MWSYTHLCISFISISLVMFHCTIYIYIYCFLYFFFIYVKSMNKLNQMILINVIYTHMPYTHSTLELYLRTSSFKNYHTHTWNFCIRQAWIDNICNAHIWILIIINDEKCIHKSKNEFFLTSCLDRASQCASKF